MSITEIALSARRSSHFARLAGSSFCSSTWMMMHPAPSPFWARIRALN